MGSESSHVDVSAVTLGWYEDSSRQPCLYPDVGIDESLLRFSGVDSNTELQAYSNELVNSVPGFISSLGSTLAGFSSVPNAVGLGALVISMILEVVVKTSTGQQEDTYAVFRRVFGEEKASSVRDTMSEYVKRHRGYINDNQRLPAELRRLETQLSGHLTILKNSMLHDGQMSSRSFKIWVNGASFHVQMLIHSARLSSQSGRATSDYVASISAFIDVYLRDLDLLLSKYKTYKISQTIITDYRECHGDLALMCMRTGCNIRNAEVKHKLCLMVHDTDKVDCNSRAGDLTEAYVGHMFSYYRPLSSLKRHFSDVKTNLVSVIDQHDRFTVSYDQSQ